MSLPFTRAQFFDVFAAYNTSLWPFALALWLLTVGAVLILVRGNHGAERLFSLLLAIHWAWTALAYHVALFSRINPAAWLAESLRRSASVVQAADSSRRGGCSYDR